ncbi:protein FAM92A-like [Acropora millepora]|uniref:protein FAM92A-like n=1 Tax=Acropora millepora TaxID=45264 RepID=UPI001CF2DB3A|nr:protein FAM92A-like [Acropora millepora]
MATNLTAALKRTLGCEKDPELLQFIKRIEETENRFIALGRRMEKYATGTHKLALKGETISSSLSACCSLLKSNDDVKTNFSKYGVHLSEIQLARTQLKEILQGTIAKDILAYARKCCEMRNKVLSCEDALRRKNQRASALQKAKNTTPVDPRKINEAHVKHEKAQFEADRAREDVNLEMKHFEEQKVTDLNRILANFLIAEMRFHAQALQRYTAAFKCLPLLRRIENKAVPKRNYDRGTSRGKKEKRISFNSSTEENSPVMGRAQERSSSSEDSRLSTSDLN